MKQFRLREVFVCLRVVCDAFKSRKEVEKRKKKCIMLPDVTVTHTVPIRHLVVKCKMFKHQVIQGKSRLFVFLRGHESLSLSLLEYFATLTLMRYF